MPAGHLPGNLWEEVSAQPGRVPGAGSAGPASPRAGGLDSWGHGEAEHVPQRGLCVHSQPG